MKRMKTAMKRRRTNALRPLAAALAALLLAGACPAAAFAGQGRSLTISTREELADFAARCASDSYSRGLTVWLEADIDLEGVSISIPIFLGTFEGGGHAITGLNLTESASVYGLFSQVAAGAVVRDLRAAGQAAPSGTQSSVGGIAGENRGTIENCAFSGVVSAGSLVGGIAGVNRTGGVIRGCTVTGAVRGDSGTGGIVGQNGGTVLRCTNTAGVNTAVSEEDIAAGLTGLDSTLYALLKNEGGSETSSGSDTGGIAGYSSGVIQICTNLGHVGYPHVGYNVGGIAGRQDGYLAGCTNRGVVEGRKDVGGIVGQMAPDVTLQLSSDKLEDLRTELNTLQSLIDRTLDDAQDLSDTASARLTRISDQADAARESADDLNRQISDFVDGSMDSVNAVSLLIDRYIDKAVPITESVTAGADDLVTAVERARDMLAGLDGLEELNDTALRQLRSACTEFESAGRAMQKAADELEAAFSMLGNDILLPDTTRLRADNNELLQAQDAFDEALQAAMDEYDATGTVSQETLEGLWACLREVLDCLTLVVKDLDEIVRKNDLGGMIDYDIEVVRLVMGRCETAMARFSDAAEHMTNGLSLVRASLDTLRAINRQLGDVFDQIDGVMESAESAAGHLRDAMDQAEQWAKDLAAEEPITFPQLGDEYDAGSAALSAAIAGMGDELDGLNGDLSGGSAALLADARAVNAQFSAIMDLFLDMLKDLSNTQIDDLYEDVSEDSLRGAVRGKVLECVNYGAVNADRNAGGVAGAMAIEYGLDPEDDLKQSDRTAQYVYQTRAVLMSCRNYGTVTAKKSCGGGIAGRMDLGVIFGCGGYGAVGGEDCEYVGGVCGLSLSSVRGSYAKCALTGSRYVGGIAGSASRVSGCVSMVEIDGTPQQRGAVAGEITGEYRNNRFVSGALAGVDRVSLSGRAEQMEYDALCQDRSLPDEFRRLTLSFTADGRLLKRLVFSYGASFGAWDFPAAPEREGCWVRWDRTDLTGLQFDTVVNAVYEPYNTALASSQTRDGRPLLLAEGQFRAGDSLTLTPADGPELAEENARILECWRVDFPADGLAERTVRWRVPEGAEGLTVWTDTGDGWKPVEAERIGGSLCFTMAGSGSFAVVSAARDLTRLYLAGAALLALIALAAAIVVIHRHRKKKKAKPQPVPQEASK